ncbi:MAG: hypothetical protein MJ094_05635 [Saccharofermentans sp.]|nr:hypothetical protein [Saccharofermentans sp.]
MVLFFAIILGVPLGTGLALRLVGSMLNKSNNLGDTKCTLSDVSKGGLLGQDFKNRVKKETPLRDVLNPRILEHRRGTINPDVIVDDKDYDNPELANINWHQ